MADAFFENNLNYSMANEDTSLERKIAQKLGPKRVLSACGSGSRVFPLIVDGVEEIQIVDLSQEQLQYCKLREETLKQLSYEQFCEFWGYSKISANKRKAEYGELVARLDLEKLFDWEKWNDPIYYGRWEKTYMKLNKLVKLFLGDALISKISSAKSIEEQWKIFKSFPFQVKWKSVLVIVGNRSLFNSLLYKGDFVKKNIPKSYVRFYIDAFERLFERNLIKDSYFLQMSFLGGVQSVEGAPTEGEEKVFSQVKSLLPHVELNYKKANIMENPGSGETFDFISISDIPSYFDEVLGESFLQDLKGSISSGGVIVVRYYLKVHSPNTSGFKDITEKFASEIKAEQVQMYEIKVYQKE